MVYLIYRNGQRKGVYFILKNSSKTTVNWYKINKWLVEAVGKSQVTISRWVTNDQQPNLYDLREVAKALDVDIRELIEPTKE